MTLQDELEDLGKLLATNLQTKGVNASYTDGLTTLANKILTVQQSSGGSCYNIIFSQPSYTMYGGGGTLTVELQSDYAPLSNATISISDGTITQTATTDNNGLATLNITGTANTVKTYTATYNNMSATCTVNFLSKPLIELIYEDKENNNYISGNSSQVTFDNNSIIYTSVLETESTLVLTQSSNWKLTFTAKGSTDNRQGWDIGYMSYGDGCFRICRDISNCFIELRKNTSGTTKVYDFPVNFMSTSDKEVIVTSNNNNITVSVNGTSYNIGTYDIKPTLGATKWGGGTVTIKNVNIESL